MVEGPIFIVLAVVAVTELFKRLKDKDYEGAATILVAGVLGLVVALIDTDIGVTDLTVAQGIVAGLGAAGVHQVARQVG